MKLTVDFSKKLGPIKPMHATNNGPVYKFAADQRVTNMDAFRAAGIPYFIIATKVDKLNATERKNNLAAIAADPALDEDTVIIPFSSLKNEGREDVLRQIGMMTGVRMSK